MTPKKDRRLYTVIATVILVAGLILILAPVPMPWSQVTQSIGTSLVAGGVIAFMDLWYGSIAERDRARVDAITDSGVSNVYPRRDLDAYYTAIESLHDSIKITGYSLRAFYESYKVILDRKLQGHSKIKIHMILVDPASSDATLREQLEGQPTGTFSASLSRLADFARQHPDNVQLRIIPSALTTMVFQIDDTMWIGPQFLSAPSRAAPTIEIRRSDKAWMFQAYEREFEHIWDMGREV